jgi:DNA-binding Lrp family transcriptional regulator
MTHAIVMIEAERGVMPTLGGKLAEIDGVGQVYSVTGSWDYVVIVHLAHHDQLAEVVTGGIGQVEGVLRTQTMVAFEAFSKHDLEALFSVGQ